MDAGRVCEGCHDGIYNWTFSHTMSLMGSHLLKDTICHSHNNYKSNVTNIINICCRHMQINDHELVETIYLWVTSV